MKTVSVVYDGHVLRPEEPLDLEPNKRYRIVIQTAQVMDEEDAWDVLDRMTGSLEGPGDWSVELDHYLYGTPKRNRTEDR